MACSLCNVKKGSTINNLFSSVNFCEVIIWGT